MLGDKAIVGFSIGISVAVFIIVSSIAALIRKKLSEIHGARQHYPEVVGAPLSPSTVPVEKYGNDMMEMWAAPPRLEIEGRAMSYELQSEVLHELQSPDAGKLGDRGHELYGPESGGPKKDT